MKQAYGIDIGGTNVKLGIVDSRGNIARRGAIPTMAEDGPDAVAERVVEWFASGGGKESEPSGAGIGCAGLVNSREGILYSSPNLPGWVNVNMEDIFSRVLGMPVVVDNDVNCAAYGEFLFGTGKEADDFFCLTLGTGVGGGLILNGALYRGFSGQAGEIGHTVIEAGGKLCNCGSRGCLEAYVKASAIIERTSEYIEEGVDTGLSIGPSITVKEISEAAEKGDAAAGKALAETGRYLGIGLANIVHMVNPRIIAVGGGVSGAGDLILGPARESLREHLMDEVLLKVEVVRAKLGNNAALAGAAMLALE